MGTSKKYLKIIPIVRGAAKAMMRLTRYFFCSSGWPFILVPASRQRAIIKSTTSQSPLNSVIPPNFSLNPDTRKSRSTRLQQASKKENIKQVGVVTEIKHDKENQQKKYRRQEKIDIRDHEKNKDNEIKNNGVKSYDFRTF